MKDIRNDIIPSWISAIAAVILIGIASCHNSPSGPNLPPEPPVPQGYINCTGHLHSYAIPGNYDRDVWYAFWNETPDSSRATLIVGIDANETDSVFLAHDSVGWGYLANDTIIHSPRLTVDITADSVIEGSWGIDAGSYFYLKKMN